jgi:hypothetical protein
MVSFPLDHRPSLFITGKWLLLSPQNDRAKGARPRRPA